MMELKEQLASGLCGARLTAMDFYIERIYQLAAEKDCSRKSVVEFGYMDYLLGGCNGRCLLDGIWEVMDGGLEFID